MTTSQTDTREDVLSKRDAKVLASALHVLRQIESTYLVSEDGDRSRICAKADSARYSLTDLLITCKVWGESENAAEALRRD